MKHGKTTACIGCGMITKARKPGEHAERPFGYRYCSRFYRVWLAVYGPAKPIVAVEARDV